MKPEIVFFGENLPEQFHRAMKFDKDEVDLLIVIGSSLKVRPVALIPSSIPHEVPQILINREPLNHLHFDVELLGDCDVIINELCQRLGSDYAKLCHNPVKLSEIKEKPPRPLRDLDIQSTDLPPTPINISEDSNLQDRTEVSSPPATLQTLTDASYTSSNSDHVLKRCSTNSVEQNGHNVTVSINTNTADNLNIDSEHAGKKECSVENKSNEENKLNNELKPEFEPKNHLWNSRCKREPISKRLDRTQYLFLKPNRYLFHGAEVYSDSDDVLSSSSCGSSSEIESCLSPSVEDPTEEDSDNEECCSGAENEPDVSTEAINDCLREKDVEKTEETNN